MSTATEPATEAPEIKLLELRVRNFIGIKARDVKPNGKSMRFKGVCGSGKSSALNAIRTIFKPLSVREVERQIHDGADAADVFAILGPEGKPLYEVSVHVAPGGHKLTIKNADGTPVENQKDLRAQILGDGKQLDPVSFIFDKEQDQLNAALEVVDVKPPVEKIKEITGKDFPAFSGESAHAYLHRLEQTFYDQRTDLGRVADQKLAALNEAKKAVNALGGPLGPDEKEVSATELNGQIDALRKKADERKALADEVQEATAHRDGVVQGISDLEAKQDQVIDAIAEVDEEMKRLTARRTLLVAQKDEITQRHTKARATTLPEAEAELETKRKKFAACPDPAPHIAELKAQLGNIETANKLIATRRAAVDREQRLAGEYKQAQAAHGHVDNCVKGIRGESANLLDGVDIGVSGLSVGDKRLLFNGRPLKQASDGENLDVAISLCVLSLVNRKSPLRHIVVDGLERFDPKRQDAFLERMAAKGIQVAAAAVTGDEELVVEIIS